MALRILDTKQLTKRTIRLMLEVTPTTAITIAKALRSQATGIPSIFTLENNTELLEVSQILISRMSAEQADYPGTLYEIWAKGKRRTHLGFKREPDIQLGKDYGRNFIEACVHFFTCVMICDGAYNPRKNTLSGYMLYGIKNEEVTSLKNNFSLS